MNKTKISSIENRPSQLYELPYYSSLPELPLHIDLEGGVGRFLAYDLLLLDGVQPIEGKHLEANKGIVGVNPSEESLKIYEQENTSFQIIHVVVNAYGFKVVDNKIHAKPYCISLKPSTKRGEISKVGVKHVASLDLEMIDNAPKHYHGFNLFSNAYGVFSVGVSPVEIENVESDMQGFVHHTFALAMPFDPHDLPLPSIPEVNNNSRVRRDYSKYRRDWYFKPFKKDKPRKIWGCDSPIELFLLQAMDRLGLSPDIQALILEDKTTVPNFHKLWENQKSMKRIKLITEADFYFPESKLAVFCDSKSHHSSEKSIKKDISIDEKLSDIGIKSLRITGPEITKSPFECAATVKDALQKA